MNEEYELKKYLKISAIVGGVWGFVNGIMVLLSFLGGIPNITINLKSIYTYIFLPYFITGTILFTTFVQEILKSGFNVMGSGILPNIALIIIAIAIPTLIGAIIICGITILVIITRNFIY